MLILLLEDARRDQDVRREEILKIPVKWHLSQQPGKTEILFYEQKRKLVRVAVAITWLDAGQEQC